MSRIIVHGLRLEYKGIITATRGWATEPTLYELKNMLANEEDLEKPLSTNDKTIKREKRREAHGLGQTKKINIKELNEKTNRRKVSTTGEWRSATIVERKDIIYARDCWYKKAEGKVATSTLNKKYEEKVWDFETSYAVKETNQQEDLVTCHFNKEEEIALTIDVHMTGGEKKLINMSEYKGGRVVVTTNNSKMPINHIDGVCASSQLKTSGTSKCLPCS
ncbi:hypothetical protein H5410_038164, partial [Solanum commersonii]